MTWHASHIQKISSVPCCLVDAVNSLMHTRSFVFLCLYHGFQAPIHFILLWAASKGKAPQDPDPWEGRWARSAARSSRQLYPKFILNITPFVVRLPSLLITCFFKGHLPVCICKKYYHNMCSDEIIPTLTCSLLARLSTHVVTVHRGIGV